MWTLYWTFVKIGAFMFGGGYSMLPLLMRELVDKRAWTTEAEILDVFAIAQCTPGVIAINTASYIGYKRKKTGGAIVATLGVITIPFFLILLIAWVLKGFADEPLVGHIFAGIRIAVAALIVSAVFRLVKGSVKDLFAAFMALAAFLLVALGNVSPVFVVLGGAVIGLAFSRIRTALVKPKTPQAEAAAPKEPSPNAADEKEEAKK